MEQVEKGDLSDEGEVIIPRPLSIFWNGEREEQQRRELQQVISQERRKFDKLRANFKGLKDEYFVVDNQKKKIENELLELRRDVHEKDRKIERLERQLKDNNPEVLRQKFESEWKEPLHRLENEKERLSSELSLAKQQIQHLEKGLVDGIEKVRLESQIQLAKVVKEKDELRLKLVEASKTPEGQRIASLIEENQKLVRRLQEKREALEENITECQKIQNKLEISTQEYEKVLNENERKIDELRLQLTTVTDTNQKLSDRVKDLRDEKESLIHDLRKMQKELSNHQEKISLLKRTFEQEKEDLKREFIQEKLDLDAEKVRFQDEVRRLKLDIEVKEEAIRKAEKSIKDCERDFLSQIEFLKKQDLNERQNMEKQKAAFEGRIAEMLEQNSRLKQDNERYLNHLERSRETCLNLEKETMVLQAKMKNFESQHEEMEKIRRDRALWTEEMQKVRNELYEMTAINKDLTIQRDRWKEDYELMRAQLEEERKQLADYRCENDKNLARLRKIIEDERDEVRQKLEYVQEEYRRKHQEREEIKSKCKQYGILVEKLQFKVKNFNDKVQELEKSQAESVPLKTHKELKRNYKELKRKYETLASLKSPLNNGNGSQTHYKHLNY